MTTAEALAMLPPPFISEGRDIIHVYSAHGIGADWDRHEVVHTIEHATHLTEAGPIAKGMGHGLQVTDERKRVWFVQTG